MKVKWSNLVLKIVVWLSAEIYLTAIGLDNLADYSEFVFPSSNQSEKNRYSKLLVEF